ncbi:DUF3261 domain-containing protein [Pseudoalteromonas luteoviolacea]|uniref:DUF3261 domain-containing protein n=1 Tax=Pseudoalteromonas luteoviolacea NCIMB 1942 TaxID=1365253 RepID=A0A167DB02_9GAMM|nr:DUF3261 domain-containing protein [Pseudoalteromonas luteoviolacea]KZN48625.1 hypothetical protein N482_07270 [Pseudoalteromonas luteoviolacea NCIMB 1942]KZX00696.1 hypothetical protein JL49_09275 [Pseudoalteromonas luteoviolacea]
MQHVKSLAMKLCVVFMMIVMSACTLVKVHEQGTVYLSKGVAMSLSSVAETLQGKHLVQLLQFEVDGQVNELIVQLEFKQREMSMVAMTATGLPVFEQTFRDDGHHELHSYIELPKVKPEYVIADIQLVHWPIRLLQQNIRGAYITEAREGNKLKRAVIVDGQPIIEINKSLEKTTFINFERNYKIEISSLDY